MTTVERAISATFWLTSIASGSVVVWYSTKGQTIRAVVYSAVCVVLGSMAMALLLVLEGAGSWEALLLPLLMLALAGAWIAATVFNLSLLEKGIFGTLRYIAGRARGPFRRRGKAAHDCRKSVSTSQEN